MGPCSMVKWICCATRAARHVRDHVHRDARAQVHDVARRELLDGPAGDDDPLVERQARRPERHADLTAHRRVVLVLELLGRHDHVVDEWRGDHDRPRVERSGGRLSRDLGDDDPAGVPGGHGHVQHAQREGIALERDVTVLVRGRALDHGHVDGLPR